MSIMTMIFLSFSTALGLIVGSFLNVVINRLYNREDIVRTRSHCRSCKNFLKWYELVPVFSFVTSRGKCRNCKNKISWQYPIVEIITALSFLHVAIYNSQFINNSLWNVLFLWAIVSGLIVIFVYDLKHFIIPDVVLIFLIIVTLVGIIFGMAGFSEDYNLLNALGAALLATFPFAALHFLSRGKWMGFGDVKLAFFMGFLLGPQNIIVALFFAFLIGAAVGSFLLLSRKKDLQSQIPFGPFLIIGTYIALFWGQNIMDWYLNKLLL